MVSPWFPILGCCIVLIGFGFYMFDVLVGRISPRTLWDELTPTQWVYVAVMAIGLLIFFGSFIVAALLRSAA